jgi:Tfp pilus assembly PilM family ATPase
VNRELVSKLLAKCLIELMAETKPPVIAVARQMVVSRRIAIDFPLQYKVLILGIA